MEYFGKSDLVALITKDGPISYKKLHLLSSSLPPIFYAYPTLESIVRILSKGPVFPISTRELSLPSLSLPPTGFLVATSGSSGKPKYAHLLVDQFLESAKCSHPDLFLKEGDFYLLSTPLYHVSGLAILFRAFLQGATVVLPNANLESVTHASFVPTQLKRFLKKPYLYPNLKTVLIGGAPIPYSLCKEAHDLGFSVYITYGMTEMASQIATTRFDPKKPIAFGPPLPGREVKIAENGEIHVRGKTLFQGYYHLPSPFVDGFFPTKDLGKMGAYGLEYIGRKDRMMISGGEHIHPEEIEKILLSCKEIEAVKVTSRMDPEFGERPRAFVVSSLSPEAIREYLSSFLPRYKIPYLEDIIITSSIQEGKSAFA